LLKKGGSSGTEIFINYFLLKKLTKMPSKTLTISAPEQLLQFLDENPSLSPSKIFQQAVENLQESIKHNPQLIEALKVNSQLQKANKQLQECLQDANEKLEAYEK
jgi:hypothetical protein